MVSLSPNLISYPLLSYFLPYPRPPYPSLDPIDTLSLNFIKDKMRRDWIILTIPVNWDDPSPARERDMGYLVKATNYTSTRDCNLFVSQFTDVCILYRERYRSISVYLAGWVSVIGLRIGLTKRVYLDSISCKRLELTSYSLELLQRKIILKVDINI